MGFKDVILNVATFGAHQRVKNETENYEYQLHELQKLNDFHEQRKSEVNEILESVVETKKIAIIKLRKVKKLTDSLNVKQRKLIEQKFEKNDYDLTKIDSSIKAGEMAMSATKGAAAGIGTAMGTWALVGTYGVASTGTAIGTLSGAAASNAILAWLGGGSVAAGGGGMAAGTLVLGGLVAIPALAITGVFQHLAANKKIKQLKEEELKITKNIGILKKNLLAFDALEKRSNEVINSINKALEGFEYTFNDAYKKIYPFGVFSQIVKAIKKKLHIKQFSDSQLEQIAEIGKVTGCVLKMVDSPIM